MEVATTRGAKFKDWFNRTFRKNYLNYQEVQDNIRELQKAAKKVEKGTDEYEKLRAEIKNEYDILKKYREGLLGASPEVKWTLIVVGGIAFFAICLDQESPKAIKIAQFVLRIISFGKAG